ncbi:MAG: metallophosphoesterase [Deferribacterales bacterium]
MRILIISDTHIDSIKNLPKILISEIERSDAVFHAGDIVGKRGYNELLSLNKNLYAVRGNVDFMLDNLPTSLTVTINNLKISITHGNRYHDIINGLLYEFADSDIIIFGHTHHPYSKMVGEQYLINPGSTSKNRWKNKETYAILELTDINYNITFYEI